MKMDGATLVYIHEEAEKKKKVGRSDNKTTSGLTIISKPNTMVFCFVFHFHLLFLGGFF